MDRDGKRKHWRLICHIGQLFRVGCIDGLAERQEKQTSGINHKSKGAGRFRGEQRTALGVDQHSAKRFSPAFFAYAGQLLLNRVCDIVLSLIFVLLRFAIVFDISVEPLGKLRKQPLAFASSNVS
jgi:hypothetical protein